MGQRETKTEYVTLPNGKEYAVTVAAPWEGESEGNVCITAYWETINPRTAHLVSKAQEYFQQSRHVSTFGATGKKVLAALKDAEVLAALAAVNAALVARWGADAAMPIPAAPAAPATTTTTTTEETMTTDQAAEKSMPTTRILTKAQAEAVYSTMCALNNVGGRVHAMLEQDHSVHVVETHTGIEVWVANGGPTESHCDQTAFAAAYGLTAIDAAAQREAVQVVTDFATRARKQYARTKEWTSHPDGSCETIRVPVALLNRVREMGDLFGLPRA